MNFLNLTNKNIKIRIPLIKQSFRCFTQNKTTMKDLDDFLPENIKYDIPKYQKNPNNMEFPLLIKGAPKLSIKVRINNK